MRVKIINVVNSPVGCESHDLLALKGCGLEMNPWQPIPSLSRM